MNSSPRTTAPSPRREGLAFGPSRTASHGSRASRSKRSTETVNWGATAKRMVNMKTKLALVMLLAAVAMPEVAQAADIDWKKVDAALGKSAVASVDVHRYGLPRSD